MAQILDVDIPTTWPSGVVTLMSERLPALHGLADGEDRIAAYRRLVIEVDLGLPAWCVRSWHCTRLCPDEIEAIRTEGMFVLSLDTLTKRLRNRVKAGDISEPVMARLLVASLAGQDPRRGSLWFSVTQHALSMWSTMNASGVGLFSLWGGETLWLNSYKDATLRSTLGQLGVPIVVEMAVPIPATSPLDVAEAIVTAFEAAEGFPPIALSHGMSFVSEHLGPDRVLRISTADDPTAASTFKEA